MFKCAIIGVSGSRARGHAAAYAHIRRGQLAAISSRQTDALHRFGDEFGIARRYADYRELFAVERPDLVHVNTPPDVRLEIFRAADEAGVPALVVEKPLAIQGEDLAAMREFAAHSRVKIAVNHQLHFHPRRAHLQHLVADGALGDVRFIDASARMNMAYQGTHTLQAIGAFNGAGRPVTTFAQIGGADGLAETPRRHYAPDRTQATIMYDNGVQALLRCGENAPPVDPARPVHQHKRIAVYGTDGLAEWTMWSWRTIIRGHEESGLHAYDAEDVLGQAALTEAMFAWLDDDHAVHPLNLARSIDDFALMLAIYTSGLTRNTVTLPHAPRNDLIAHMRTTLRREDVGR